MAQWLVTPPTSVTTAATVANKGVHAGNVVTVEPGVYLSGLGGVRIEDLVIVGEGPPEVLTTFTKELVTLR